MRFLSVLFGLLVVGVGVLAGGCSLFFTPFMSDGGGDIGLTWIAGLVIGVAGIWGGIKIIGSATGSAGMTEGGPYQPPPKDDDERLR